MEHLDVVIVGAGISGIDFAHHLQQSHPTRTYALLEARGTLGGTWDLFRYPGIRSDSDMYTLGFPFDPWTGDESIVDGRRIWSYVDATARRHGITERIRDRTRVVAMSWDGAASRWTLDLETPAGPSRVTAGWVHTCTGYYDYDAPYTPELPGLDGFAGRVVHPQHWPADLDVAGRDVVVLGSGATAVSLVPALVDAGAHVTMLQRSPGYVMPLGSTDPLQPVLRRVLGRRRTATVLRWKNVLTGLAFYRLTRSRPAAARRLVDRLTRRARTGIDPVHFTPAYDPWDQRLCVAPDGDLYAVLRTGAAQVVTDTVAEVTPAGVRTSSGRVLPADVLVTATGLRLLAGGGISITVDGEPVDLGRRFLHRGLMLAGVPNATLSMGYVNASWTLRADLISQYVCRLIARLDERGATAVRAVPPPGLVPTPLMSLTSGYVLRAAGSFPFAGDRGPWRVRQDYLRDRADLRRADLDEDLAFT